MDKTGEDYNALVNLKNVTHHFSNLYQFIDIKMLFTQLENHSQLLYGHDFANDRFLLCQFDI